MQTIQAPESSLSRARRLAAEVKANAGNATTTNSLKDEVTKLSEIVDILLDKLD